MTEKELTRRLEKLERDNRRLKAFALGAMILAAAAGAIYAERPAPDVITAHAFTVPDGSGKVRIVMDTSGAGSVPSIRLLDANGQEEAALEAIQVGTGAQGFETARLDLKVPGNPDAYFEASARPDSGFVEVASTPGSFINAGTLRKKLAQGKSAILDIMGDGISMADPAGESAELAMTGKQSLLWLNDQTNQGMDSFLTSTGVLFSAANKPWATINVSPTGEPSMELTDPQGFTMDLGGTSTSTPATGTTVQTSAASIIMFGGNDSNHRVIWKAP